MFRVLVHATLKGFPSLAHWRTNIRCMKSRQSFSRLTREGHAYGASRLPKTSENDCFAVYFSAKWSRFYFSGGELERINLRADL